MNILYNSVHAILEYDEVKLFTEMGHNVFALGSYINPLSPVDVKRPAINGKYDDHKQFLAIQCSKDNLDPELIAWADVIMWMHRPDWIMNNWPKVKGKKCVWRSIGQSTKDVEDMMILPRNEGLKLVRYSPEECNIEHFLGVDAVIRFYKDETEFYGYNGHIPEVINVSQGMKDRGKSCGFDIFDEVTKNIPRKLFGPNNESSGIPGGLLSYDDLKAAYRDHRVYFYTGTYPAPYTLNLMEAMMTGMPVVAIGKRLADLGYFQGCTYEVDKIIQDGVNGYCSDDIAELRGRVEYLLANPEKAKEIGEAGRKTAIELWGKEKIKADWVKFFKTLEV